MNKGNKEKMGLRRNARKNRTEREEVKNGSSVKEGGKEKGQKGRQGLG